MRIPKLPPQWGRRLVFVGGSLLLVYLGWTGIHLTFHEELDLARLRAINAHRAAGYACVVLMFFGLIHHLEPHMHWRALVAAILVTFVFGLLIVSEIPPFEQLVIYSLVLTAAWCLLGIRLATSPKNPNAGRWSVFTGAAAAVVLGLALASGLFVGGFMFSLGSNVFHVVHRWSGWLLFVPLAAHMVWGRRQPMARGWLYGMGAASVVAAASIAIGHVSTAPPTTQERGNDEDEAAVERDIGGEGCGVAGCHTEIYKQWRDSVHRYSSANLPYRKVLDVFVAEKGRNAASYCDRCHAPSRAMGRPATEVGADRIGIGCKDCHLMVASGPCMCNGHAEFAAEQQYLPEGREGKGASPSLVREFIRRDMAPHRDTYGKLFHRTAEFCAVCHRVVVPADLTGGEERVIDGIYGPWKRSRFAREGIGCTHCHLQLNEFADPESMEKLFHARPDHRMFGIHPSLGETVPSLRTVPRGDDLFLRQTLDWLNGGLKVSDYEKAFLRYRGNPRYAAYVKYFAGRPLLDLEMALVRRPTDTGADLLVVKTTNARIGHNFPGGLLGLVDCWLEVEVVGVRGEILFTDGALDRDGSHPQTSHRLGADFFDASGEPIRSNRFWAIARVENLRVLPPESTLMDEFEIGRIPAGSYPVTVRVRWWYRRYRREFAEWALGEGTRLSATPIAEAQRVFDRSSLRGSN